MTLAEAPWAVDEEEPHPNAFGRDRNCAVLGCHELYGAPDGAPPGYAESFNTQENDVARGSYVAPRLHLAGSEVKRRIFDLYKLGTVWHHTEMGVPLAKVAHVLRTTFGLHVTPGGLAHLLHRTARDAAPTYTALCQQVRNSPVITPDETGWRVGAVRHWLWTYVTPATTVYAICPGRGFDDASTVLGADFAGVLLRDGWVSYCVFR